MNNTTTDPRRAAFELTAAGIAAGLPIPRSIDVGDGLSHGRLELVVREDDTNAVDRWAAWLDLPAPVMILAPMQTAHRAHRATEWFQPYEARSGAHPATGRQVIVKSYLTVAAPADATGQEVAR